MSTQSRRLGTIVFASVIVVAGAATGSIGGLLVSSSFVGAQQTIDSPEYPTSARLLEEYPVSATGQTYGDFGVGLVSDPSAHPVLVRVVATNGREGYALWNSVFGNDAANLAEALNASEPRAEFLVPVFDLDGAVIGEYRANAGF